MKSWELRKTILGWSFVVGLFSAALLYSIAGEYKDGGASVHVVITTPSDDPHFEVASPPTGDMRTMAAACRIYSMDDGQEKDDQDWDTYINDQGCTVTNTDQCADFSENASSWVSWSSVPSSTWEDPLGNVGKNATWNVPRQADAGAYTITATSSNSAGRTESQEKETGYDESSTNDSTTVNVVKVDLLVNDTASETDDYVVKEKPGGARTTPVNTPAGETDNYIPLKVQLSPNGVTAKVYLTDSGGGNITIKKTTGEVYEGNEENVTGGTDLDLKIYGATASSALNDVTITAKTDKTGDDVCGTEDLTVIWVASGDMSFRGSANQGAALTSGSTAEFTDFHEWREDKVGKFIYHEPTESNQDKAHYQMELKNQITPNVVISDVEWDIKREASIAYWGPGTTPRSKTVFKGENDWADDDSADNDEDLIQNATPKEIFSIDSPGYSNLPYTSDYGYSEKNKFQEWIEAKIGTKWYIASTYKTWRSVMYLIYSNDEAWIENAEKTNEIVTGTIAGFAGTWSED